jgi:hypothetical protein
MFQIDVHSNLFFQRYGSMVPTLGSSIEEKLLIIVNSIQDLAGVHNTALIEELFDTLHDLDAFLAL